MLPLVPFNNTKRGLVLIDAATKRYVCEKLSSGRCGSLEVNSYIRELAPGKERVHRVGNLIEAVSPQGCLGGRDPMGGVCCRQKH